MAAWTSVEYLDVVLSGVAAFGVGAVWYGVLGERWMAAVGRTKAEIQADKSPLPFIIAFAAALSASAFLGVLMNLVGLSGPMQGGALGLAIGAFVAAPWLILHYAFAARPRDLWWIDGLHTIVSLTVAGLALGLFI